jgi:mRNA interferase RelE/StbE
MDVNPSSWTVVLTRTALEQLAKVKDKRVQQALRKRLEGLGQEPDKQGKALVDELMGYRSIRAAGQRYRIIYRLEETRVIVYIVGIGLRAEGSRKDVYAVAQQLLNRGLLDPDEE